MKHTTSLFGVSALAIALYTVSAQSPEFQRTEGDDWAYLKLESRINLAPEAITSPSYLKIAEFEDIDVSGYRTARIFVDLTEKDFFKSKGNFKVGTTNLEVSAFHNMGHGSNGYVDQKVVANATTSFSGYVEVPIVGPSLRLVVWGHAIPKIDMNFDCTIYLLD